jgi:hypothetical protein
LNQSRFDFVLVVVKMVVRRMVLLETSDETTWPSEDLAPI